MSLLAAITYLAFSLSRLPAGFPPRLSSCAVKSERIRQKQAAASWHLEQTFDANEGEWRQGESETPETPETAERDHAAVSQEGKDKNEKQRRRTRPGSASSLIPHPDKRSDKKTSQACKEETIARVSTLASSPLSYPPSLISSSPPSYPPPQTPRRKPASPTPQVPTPEVLPHLQEEATNPLPEENCEAPPPCPNSETGGRSEQEATDSPLGSDVDNSSPSVVTRILLLLPPSSSLVFPSLASSSSLLLFPPPLPSSSSLLLFPPLVSLA
eukprot:768759-Hanusia_phi.AAC.9